MREVYLKKMTDLKATLKITFKTPKVSALSAETPTRLSTKDCDFFEREILRLFFINVSRVVDFEFCAYAEDRAYDDDKKFVGLHYHAVARSRNDSKFIAIAEEKYRKVIESAFKNKEIVMQNKLLFIEKLESRLDESYEDYCLKHYCPSRSLVTDLDFRRKSFQTT